MSVVLLQRFFYFPAVSGALSLNVPAQLGLQITLGRPLGLALSTLIFSYRSPETKLMTAATSCAFLPSSDVTDH